MAITHSSYIFSIIAEIELTVAADFEGDVDGMLKAAMSDPNSAFRKRMPALTLTGEATADLEMEPEIFLVQELELEKVAHMSTKTKLEKVEQNLEAAMHQLQSERVAVGALKTAHEAAEASLAKAQQGLQEAEASRISTESLLDAMEVEKTSVLMHGKRVEAELHRMREV
jgi:hypothetical protein